MRQPSYFSEKTQRNILSQKFRSVAIPKLRGIRCKPHNKDGTLVDFVLYFSRNMSKIVSYGGGKHEKEFCYFCHNDNGFWTGSL